MLKLILSFLCGLFMGISFLFFFFLAQGFFGISIRSESGGKEEEKSRTEREKES